MLSGWQGAGWHLKAKPSPTAVSKVRSRVSALSWQCKRPTLVPAVQMPAKKASILTVWCHHVTIKSTNPNRYRCSNRPQKDKCCRFIVLFSQSSIFDLIYSVWHFAIAQITNLNDLNHFPEEQYSNFVQLCKSPTAHGSKNIIKSHLLPSACSSS